MSYDPINKTVKLPVFLPSSLIQLKIPEEMMTSAIQVFNEKIVEEPLELWDGKNIKARVKTLRRIGDDLFLYIYCFDEDGYKLDNWVSKMIGYAVMNKNTGEIVDIVIEGFKWVQKKSVDFPQKSDMYRRQ